MKASHPPTPENQGTDFERLFEELGFVSRPLFGPAHTVSSTDGQRNVVMLDGAVASFVVTVQDHPATSHLQIEDEEFYDWA